jgi:3-oxoacyl-(acyl-carrier-protein) synthase
MTTALAPAAAIAVTGYSVLTPLGDSVPALAAALRTGTSHVAIDSDFDAACTSRLQDFDPMRYAKVRGMRVYARATQLEICAVALALADAGFAEGAIDPLQLGVVTASSFSHLETLIEYDRNLMTLGMQRTNPTLMPLGLPSAPGAATALSIGAKAFAITLNDGGAAGLAALGLGARLLAEGRARVCVVAGAATICRELVNSAAQAKLLSPTAPLCVLDEASRGTAFGEAAAALVLEPAADALARGRPARGFLRAQASSFAPGPQDIAPALARACQRSLQQGKIAPAALALLSSGASGIADSDRAHAIALLRILGDAAQRPAVTALKGNLGEVLDPSGLLQCITALHALRERVAPPIAALERPNVPGLRYLTRESELDAGAALLTATSSTGACSALVVSSD